MIEKTQNGFVVHLIGIIFDPSTKKILIWKKDGDEDLPGFSWGFLGGRAVAGEDVDITLKSIVKERTGLSVANLGSVFSKTYPEKENLIGIYFLCESFEGDLKPGKDVMELKWVDPEELENHFTTSFHPRLKEYILNLK